MLPLFEGSYWIACENLPIIKYDSLYHLFDKIGVEKMEGYKRKEACKDFLNSIYHVLHEELIKELKNSEQISIMIDSTSLNRKREVLCIVVRFIDSNFMA